MDLGEGKITASKTNIVWLHLEKEPVFTEADNRTVLGGLGGTVGNCRPME